MSDTARAAGGSGGHEGGGGDWAAKLTKLVETVVEVIRDKSVRPAFIVATGIVVTLAVLGTLLGAAILAVTGITRLFDNEVFDHRVWATYTLFGGIFTLAGVLVLAMGNRSATRSLGER